MATDLTPDCSKCASLCCIGFFFDESDKFAYSKPAGEPCRNLCGNGLCAIHDRLSDEGFDGCVEFDCQGAGQRVTQDLFDGKTWRHDPALLEPMMAAFRKVRKLHEVLALLQAARKLPLPYQILERLDALISELDPVEPWTRSGLAAAGLPPLLDRATQFLAGLRAHVSPTDIA